MNYRHEVRQFEIRLLRRALRQTRGNMSQAARLLEMHRNTMISRCNSLGVDPSAFIPTAMGEAMKRWRKKRMEQGLCRDCGSQPFGGEGGTSILCPICAQKHRERAREQHRREMASRPPKPEPPPIIPRPLDQVFRKLPPKPVPVEQKPLVSRTDRMLALAAKTSRPIVSASL